MKITDLEPNFLAECQRILRNKGINPDALEDVIFEFNSVSDERASWEPFAFRYFIQGYAIGWEKCLPHD